MCKAGKTLEKRTKKRIKKYWRNLKEIKWVALKRFLELVVLSAFFSVLTTICKEKGILTTKSSLSSTLVLMYICFMLLDVFLMRKNYYYLAHRRKYYMANYIAHGTYMAINLFYCKNLNSMVYKYFFSITGFIGYSHMNISMYISAIVFNIILILGIRLASVGMQWLHMNHG